MKVVLIFRLDSLLDFQENCPNIFCGRKKKNGAKELVRFAVAIGLSLTGGLIRREYMVYPCVLASKNVTLP